MTFIEDQHVYLEFTVSQKNLFSLLLEVGSLDEHQVL